MADITPKSDSKRNEEDIGNNARSSKLEVEQAHNPVCKRLRKYPERTSNRITEEKNEFIARNSIQDCERYYPKITKFKKPTIKGLYGPGAIRRNPYGPCTSTNAKFIYGPNKQY